MTLATHSTQAPAARKRGGGPAHIHQVNAMTIGRQPLPEGGEIKSLCRAAAGIIRTLSASIEARVYPTDRVRGAQKMEPRSANQPSPAAQPVKGYVSTSSVARISREVIQEVLTSRVIQLQPRNDRLRPIAKAIPIAKLLSDLLSVSCHNFKFPQHIDLLVVQISHWNCSQSFDMGLPFQSPAFVLIVSDRSVLRYNRLPERSPETIKRNHLVMGEKLHHRPNAIISLPLLDCFMHVGESCSAKDRKQCSKGLKPGCCRYTIHGKGQNPQHFQVASDYPVKPNENDGPPQQPHKKHRMAVQHVSLIHRCTSYPVSFLRLPATGFSVHGGGV